MNQNLTEIAFILDRSGSMVALADEAIGAFNSFLNDQKKQPGECRFTLAIFDHEYRLEHDEKNVQEAPELNRDTYKPRGTTALLDAIGRTLDDIGQKLSRTPEKDRPAKVIVAVLTDGLDNASRDYSKAKVDEMIQQQRDKYAWNFQFLAASQDAIVSTIGRTVDVELRKILDRLATAIILYLILVYGDSPLGLPSIAETSPLCPCIITIERSLESFGTWRAANVADFLDSAEKVVRSIDCRG
jgi:hypothetical protein